MTYTVPRALIKRHKKNLPVRAMHKFSSRALDREPHGYTNGTATCGRNEERKKDK